MASTPEAPTSFLGTGWSFPPEFIKSADGRRGELRMSEDEQDIKESLEILFRTTQGERFLNPRYGLDMRELLFEPVSTTMRAFLLDRIKTALLIDEPRINLRSLEVRSRDPNGLSGELLIAIEYEVRATNSRYNLVFPFYREDSNELRTAAHTKDL
jgi:uncharacterized protein